jgi:FlgN protein
MSPTAICESPTLSSVDADLLERHLTHETTAQQEVLRHLGEQERLLAGHDVAGLKRLLSGSDPVLARLQEITEARIRIMEALGKGLGRPAAEVTIARVLDALEPRDRDRLGARAAEVRKLVAEVERRTRRVTVLLRCAAETNDALLHGILGGEAPLRPYQPDGRRAPSAGLSHFTREF